MRSVTIHVCTTCRRADDEAESRQDVRQDVRPGARLHAAVERVAAGEPALSVEPVECLGNCRRGCTVALRTQGAWTYVFGDLDAGSAADVLAAARLMAGTADGLMPWRPRPEPFKRGMIARLPPLPIKDAAE